jgi:branched-chain amino acid aminotransferase
MAAATNWSKTWTFFDDQWREGNVPIMGTRTHAAWLCSIVFDGARALICTALVSTTLPKNYI